MRSTLEGYLVIFSCVKSSSFEKEELILKVRAMGGISTCDEMCIDTLRQKKSLFVADFVVDEDNKISFKYLEAVRIGKPVVRSDFIERLWEISGNNMDSFHMDELLNAYKIPIFAGVAISCTNLPVVHRRKLNEVLSANGGTYREHFPCSKTTLLISPREGCGSDRMLKVESALENHVPIVTWDWFIDSCNKGLIQDPSKYLLKLPASEEHLDRNDWFYFKGMFIKRAFIRESRYQERGTSSAPLLLAAGTGSASNSFS